jgi:hypothetical protein
MRNGRSYSADPLANPNWAQTLSLCGQLMEKAEANADVQYYGADWRVLAAQTLNNQTDIDNLHGPDANNDNVADDGSLITDSDWSGNAVGGYAFMWPVTTGNPDLDPEKADTWTFGFVLDSFIDDIPALMDWGFQSTIT